jgi:hypothetical protein
MTSILHIWRRWRTREERRVVHSRWLWRLTPDLRERANRAMLAEPALAGELTRILGHDESLDEHFVLGFTAQADPISPQKRLSDGFAAMALRCEQLRAEAFMRRRVELERSAERAASKSSPEEYAMEVSEK